MTNSPKKQVSNRKKMLPKRLAKEGAVDTRRSKISKVIAAAYELNEL